MQVVDASGTGRVIQTQSAGELPLELAPGTYSVVVEKEGFRDEQREVSIAPRGTTELTIQLTATAPPPPLAGSKGPGRVANPVGAPMLAKPVASAVTAAAKPSLDNRELAKWFLARGAKVDMQSGNTEVVRVSHFSSLPAQAARLTGLNWDHRAGAL